MGGRPITFELRRMEAADIDAAVKLSTLAGWNQTRADWRRLQKLEPDGCFVASINNLVVGTVTTTSYQQRLGWIGMVLVHPDVQRCGMGSALLRHGLEYLDSQSVETVKLDATALGQPVYERAGFVVEYELERWDGTVAVSGQSTLQSIQQTELPTITEFDAEVFGADRSNLLRELYDSAPEYSAVCFRDGKLSGYALGRRGVRANYLGPWVASDANTARQLAHSILHHWAGENVYVDINLTSSSAVKLVRGLGLRPQRKFLRMYKGPNNFPGQPQWGYGIAGPEVG